MKPKMFTPRSRKLMRADGFLTLQTISRRDAGRGGWLLPTAAAVAVAAGALLLVAG